MKKIGLTLIIVLSALLVIAGGLFTYSWLSPYGKVVSEDGEMTYAKLGMKLDLLFDMINSNSELTVVPDGTKLGIVSTDYDVSNWQGTTETVGTMTKFIDTEGKYIYGIENYGVSGAEIVCYYLFDSDAGWGTANNPYIISNVRHIQNLSILQEIGYFYDLYVSKYYEGGTFTYNGEDCMPYFLVCKPDGTPVTVEGGHIQFSPIGTDAYPFIGYVGGAFINGTTTVGGESLSCDQSVIKDINIQTTDDLVDVGFFGAIGYLKNTTAEPSEEGKFEGYISTIRDFLLYDVTITVRQTTIVDIIGKFADHLFSFSKTETVAATEYSVPHENHHFGILAGHVEYSTVKYISVYYSDEDTAAIDVSHIVADTTKMPANYFSVCGIIGYIDHMNATAGDGMVDPNGVSNDSVAANNGGIGSGGGTLSGTGRGYVTASSLYNNYYTQYDNAGTGTRGNVSAANRTGQEVWSFTKKGNIDPEYGIMVVYDGSEYYLYNHPEMSVVLGQTSSAYTADVYYSSDDPTLYDRWSTYIVCNTTADSNVYLAYDGSELSSFRMLDLVILNGISLENGNNLCTEYVRDRILWGTQPTGMYYFYDGVFTFALSNKADTIEDTWKNDTPDDITVGLNDATKWTTDASGQSNAVVAFAKPVTEQSQLAEGKTLFITYKDSSNNYHLVTLAANSDYTQGNLDDAVTTPATQLGLVSSETKATLKAALDLGALSLDPADEESGVLITEEQLKAQWNDISVFDIGGATSKITLDELKKRYQVRATWDSSSADQKIYEDDGVTEATEALKSNSQTYKNNFYLINSTIDTDITVSGTSRKYFELGTNPTTVNVSDLSTAISTQNGKYYEDDWTTETTNSSSPLSARLSVGSALTQDEWTYYDNGYFYFWTQDYGWFNCTFKYFYVDPDGNVTTLGTKSCGLSNWEERLKGFFTGGNRTDPNNSNVTLYKITTKIGGKQTTLELPLLYELSGTYYDSWKRNTNVDHWIDGVSVASIDSGIYRKTHSVQHHYIVASLTGNGMTYTLDGTSTVCSDVTKTARTVATRENEYLGIYKSNSDKTVHKAYDVYSCKVNGTPYDAILITRYVIDGYSLKSLNGNGITYKLNNSATLSGKGTITQSIVQPTIPSGMTNPGWSRSLAGNNYTLYTVDNKLVVRVANYNIDGYILATITNTGVTYALNATTTQTNVEQYIKDAQGNPLTIKLSNGTLEKNYKLYTSDQGKLAIELITNGQTGGTYKFWHKNAANPGSTVYEGDPFVLRLLRRAYVRSYYSVMVGTNEYANNGQNFRGATVPTVSNNSDATVIFNNDGSVNISYTVNGNKRYLRYDTTNNHFDSATSVSDSGAKLYLFTVEGTHDTKISNQIIPIAGTSKGTFSADQYVLYPQSTLTGSDTQQLTSDDPVYKLYSLQGLVNDDPGWINSQGLNLSKEDLHKRFKLTDEITWNMTLNVFNGSWNFGSGGINNKSSVVAPIGTNGDEVNIPKGCIAFKINESNATGYGIRVIVSIPVSAYYPGQTDPETLEELYDLDEDEDYYFGLWNTENAGASLIQSFQKTNSIEKFELPRSHPYPVGADPAASEYITVQFNGETCRAYLHGDQILVAYKFTVTDPGIYVLGATNGPMEIVYFSADSTASAGRDGTSSYKLGTIDFVYNYNGRIVTVKDGAESGSGEENYNYYYPTLCLLSTANSATPVAGDTQDIHEYKAGNGVYWYPNINYFKMFTRRVIGSDEGDEFSEIKYKVSSDNAEDIYHSYDKNYLPFVRYALNADIMTIIESNN